MGELGRREEALAAIQEATDLCRELTARWPDAYHQELRSVRDFARKEWPCGQCG
jgi:hypothetical protein